jgi:hypothetical protein
MGPLRLQWKAGFKDVNAFNGLNRFSCPFHCLVFKLICVPIGMLVNRFDIKKTLMARNITFSFLTDKKLLLFPYIAETIMYIIKDISDLLREISSKLLNARKTSS